MGGYPAVKSLYADYVDVRPVTFDWTACRFDEEWEFFEAFRCEECGAVVGPVLGETHHQDVDCETTCKGYVGCGEGPMMNYYYPMDTYDGDPVEGAKKLVDLPLCIVYVHGKYGLALTGGGMDLTWEICEAFMKLGYLPPIHFCSPPRWAGLGLDVKHRWILSGCRRSLLLAQGRIGYDLKRLARLRRSMKGEEGGQRGG